MLKKKPKCKGEIIQHLEFIHFQDMWHLHPVKVLKNPLTMPESIFHVCIKRDRDRDMNLTLYDTQKMLFNKKKLEREKYEDRSIKTWS